RRPLQRRGERTLHRHPGRGPGLAHRHVVPRRDGLRERALRHHDPASQRARARRHGVRQHARGVRGPARGGEDPVAERDRAPRLREVLGAHAAGPGQHAPRADRRATPASAAGHASAVHDPPDHRAHAALREPRLHDPDQRALRAGERRDAGVPLRSPAPRHVSLALHVDRARPARLGSPRHDPSRHRGLRTRRVPAHEALPGDGDEDLRSGLRSRGRERAGAGLSESSPAVAGVVRPRAKLSTFAALRAPNYCLYWIGLGFYVLGHRAEYVTFALFVWELTHDPLYLGYLGLAQGVPLVVFQIFGGVLADRVNRLRLLIVTQLLTAVTLAVAFGLTVLGLARIEHLLVLAALSNTFRAFDEPSRLSLVPQLIDRARLSNAIALGSIPWQAGRMLGPSITGILIAAFGGALGL